MNVAAADFSQSEENGACHLRFTGRLTLARIGDLPERLEEVHAEKLVADVSQVERMDTVGAWLIHRLVRDQGAEVVGADEDQALLLQQVRSEEHTSELQSLMRISYAVFC